MSQYTSYYLYERYEKRGEQDWIPCYPNTYSISGDATNPMSLVVKSENDTQCGYTPTPTEPMYRWVNLDPSTDYYCDGVAKYYKQQRQVSYDGGTTWSNVTPSEYQMGTTAETSSSDCGGGTIMYRTTSGASYCSGSSGYDKYIDVYSQVSYNNGSTWTTTATTPTLVEVYSRDCGFIPCTTASTTCYSSTNNVTADEVAGTATTNTIRWDWSGITTTRTTACTSADTEVGGSASTAVTFSTNYGDSARTISGTVQWNVNNCNGSASGLTVPYSFVQRRACHPTTAYCYTSVSNVSAEDAPAAATSNTITWDYVGTQIVTNVECEQIETPITGSSSGMVVMPMNTQYSAITVSGTYYWPVTQCNGSSGGIYIPYSFTQKSAGDGVAVINFYSSLSDIVNISRLTVRYSDSTTNHYYNVNTGPVYQGSSSAARLNLTWSTSRKISSMQAAYTMTGQSGTRTHYVKLPSGGSVESNPTFTFSSDYLQGGMTANFYITP